MRRKVIIMGAGGRDFIILMSILKIILIMR